MTADRFNRLLELRITAIRESLVAKAKEYATADRLHNFKAGAAAFKEARSVPLPTEVCWGYLLKHLVWIKDVAGDTRPYTPDAVHERIGDAINYLILMEALLLEECIDRVLTDGSNG